MDRRRKRLPEKIERIFNHYKKIKWIDGYELTDTENEFLTITKKSNG